jgi:hypothetical protein
VGDLILSCLANGLSRWLSRVDCVVILQYYYSGLQTYESEEEQKWVLCFKKVFPLAIRQLQDSFIANSREKIRNLLLMAIRTWLERPDEDHYLEAYWVLWWLLLFRGSSEEVALVLFVMQQTIFCKSNCLSEPEKQLGRFLLALYTDNASSSVEDVSNTLILSLLQAIFHLQMNDNHLVKRPQIITRLADYFINNDDFVLTGHERLTSSLSIVYIKEFILGDTNCPRFEQTRRLYHEIV